MERAVLLRRVARSAPSEAQVARIRNPAPSAGRRSPEGGPFSGPPASTATTRLEAAAVKNVRATREASTTPRASNFPRKSAVRPGRWVRIVLNVAQPYSLPAARAPRIRAIGAPTLG